jgi:adenylate cyclase
MGLAPRSRLRNDSPGATQVASGHRMSDLGGVSRKLVAVFAADVEGYSRLMGVDEVDTLKGLTERRAILDRFIEEHRGRIANTAGDSVLAEFGSAVDAVRCAVEAQIALADANSDAPPDKRISFRIGIHIGDVMIRAGDLFGDGVNIAARLQSIAKPGCVCISGVTYDQVRKVLPMTFADLGAQQIKNIQEPVRAYQVNAPGEAREVVSARVAETESPPPLPDKPSIAVLPFQNMSGDPEQEYFADGIAEDVLTTLSKIQELMVIARNSSFVFKGQTRDIREIGRTLGVRYVLEGSVRKAGNRVRLAAQLIDSLNGGHVWADRFEGDLDDVFELQDRITQDIVAALEVRLTFGEQTRVWRKRSGSPLVYEHFLKCRTLYVKFARHTHAQARNEAEQALAINPTYSPALFLLGFILTDQVRFGWRDQATTYEAAVECATRDLATDPNSHLAYETLGYARLYQRRHNEALHAGENAIALGPNCSDAYHVAGMVHGYAGDFRKSAQYEEQAQRLSPLSLSQSMGDEARVKFHLGNLAAARDIALRVLVERPHWITAQVTLAASLWNLGSEDEAASQ